MRLVAVRLVMRRSGVQIPEAAPCESRLIPIGSLGFAPLAPVRIVAISGRACTATCTWRPSRSVPGCGGPFTCINANGVRRVMQRRGRGCGAGATVGSGYSAA